MITDHSIALCLTPKTGLKVFDTYMAMKQWMKLQRDLIVHRGVTINLTQNVITFPNGNKLFLGWDKSDLNKYMGCRFSFVHGIDNPERFLEV